jgi:hypothetical protein
MLFKDTMEMTRRQTSLRGQILKPRFQPCCKLVADLLAGLVDYGGLWVALSRRSSRLWPAALAGSEPCVLCL